MDKNACLDSISSVRFVNEYNNEIVLTVTDLGEFVEVTLDSPETQCSWKLTPLEAQNLRDILVKEVP